MNHDKISLQQVIAGLQAEGLLPDSAVSRIDTVLNNMSNVSPWYIRTMVGLGAWLASLFLIGFVGSVGIAVDGGFILVGTGLIIGAIFARRKSDNDFMVQGTLACSLAGQAILAYGIVEFVNGDEFEGVLGVVTIISIILFFIFPDRIHRVLSVMIATTSISSLLYIWELNAVVPFLGPAFAAALVVLYQRQGAFTECGKGHLVRPLVTAMMLSAFGFMLLSTVYILPDINVGFSIYPRPWISTILLGAVFLYMGTQIWPQLTGADHSAGASLFYGLLVVVAAAAWAAPGLLLALIVLMLGASSGNRTFIGFGVAFLVVFIGTFFYGIEVTMLTKSITLVLTGSAVLLGRWLIMKTLADVNEGGAKNA